MKYENLIICYTPLQTIIAKRIIEEEKLKNIFIIYFYQINNKKNKHYFNELSKVSKKSFYIKKFNILPYITFILTILTIYLKILFLKNHSVYTGNPKTIYSRFIISILKPKNIYSFDDGIGNISNEGYFYVQNNFTSLEKLIRFFGMDFSYKFLYEKIKNHYTIYSTANALPRPIKINLFPINEKKEEKNKKESLSILLTCPISEDNVINIDKEKKLYNTIIDLYGIELIIKHPLEKRDKIEKIPYIDSEKIAEEIILDLSNLYNKITIYAWYSSALINLNNIPGIDLVNYTFESSFEINKIHNLLIENRIKSIWIDI
jgi:beta-galactosamide-alpha-2,3-sialyltransferase